MPRRLSSSATPAQQRDASQPGTAAQTYKNLIDGICSTLSSTPVDDHESDDLVRQVVRHVLSRAAARPNMPIPRQELVALVPKTGGRVGHLASQVIVAAQRRLATSFGMELKELATVARDPGGLPSLPQTHPPEGIAPGGATPSSQRPRAAAPAPAAPSSSSSRQFVLRTLLPSEVAASPARPAATGFALVVMALIHLSGGKMSAVELWAALAELGVSPEVPDEDLGGWEEALAALVKQRRCSGRGWRRWTGDLVQGPVVGRASRRLAYMGAGAMAGGALSYRHDTTLLWFEAYSFFGGAIRCLDAERAHALGVWACSKGLLPRDGRRDPPSLRTEVWGRTLSNPLGLAAGFDKSAEAMEGALELGFGLVELGSVTPLPQPGNPKPRVFRLPSAGAVINRYGFNNDGLDAAKSRLERFRERARAPRASPRLRSGLVGVNVGKNKTTSDGAADFCAGVSALAPLADYLVVNVSSPNTPGLRALQSRAALEQLLRRVLAARDGLAWDEGPAPPLLLKIAPDLDDDELRDVAAVALDAGVDGLVVSNTTVERPPEVRELTHGQEAGGLSGRPLMEASTAVLAKMYRLTGGRLPIVGVGGVSSGEDAYRKIRAGASVVQLYTAFVYGGPALIPRIKRELAACLERDGFTSVAQAVGADHREGRDC